MKQPLKQILGLLVLCSFLLLPGCKKEPQRVVGIPESPDEKETTAQTEPVPQETFGKTEETETFEDGTTATTVRERAKNEDGSVTETVVTTTNCTDGTVLIDRTVDTYYTDGSIYNENYHEFRDSEQGGNGTLETYLSKPDGEILQTEEEIIFYTDGTSYAEGSDYHSMPDGTTKIVHWSAQRDAQGIEDRTEEVTWLDAEGNAMEAPAE